MKRKPRRAGRKRPRTRAAHARALLRHRLPAPGARPGALALPADAPSPRLRFIGFGPERLVEREDVPFEELPALLRQAPVAWLDVEGLGDEATLSRLGEILELHPLALADVANVPQRPKCDSYDDRHLIVTRMARSAGNGAIDLEQVSLVLGPGFVASFQERPGDVFDPVRQRLRSGGALRRQGADFLAHALLDAVIDGYFPVLEAMGETLEGLEEEVIERPRRASIARIHRVRRTLLTLHRILWRQRDALAGMLREEGSPFSAPVRVYLRDAYDHAVELLDVLESYREITIGLMEFYLSAASNRMNEVMKTLTVMASIFIPLTFVVGVYGMNFRYMPELDWRWGYPTVWGVMIAVGLALLALFWRRGWLGERDEDVGG